MDALREDGHKVYDFRRPAPDDHGFSWNEIDKHWKSWSGEEFITALQHQTAERGFANDFRAMQWAEVCVLVLRCGRSAHLEGGWFVGFGKPLLILLNDGEFEPELMYKMADSVHCTLASVRNRLKELQNTPPQFGIGYARMQMEIECLKFACANTSAEWDEMRTALADLCTIDQVSTDPEIVKARVTAHEAALRVLRDFADEGDILACTTAAKRIRSAASNQKEPPPHLLDCTSCGYPISQHSADHRCPNKPRRSHQVDMSEKPSS
ncbi:MAG: hypothetical protein H6818_06835 [Phycisphaerales bacterium]|nr:hypothetical protein [Phycisphaerales bacterium]MCB9864872.1 hypothetical protein [Phycisphaerales bacterium]